MLHETTSPAQSRDENPIRDEVAFCLLIQRYPRGFDGYLAVVGLEGKRRLVRGYIAACVFVKFGDGLLVGLACPTFCGLCLVTKNQIKFVFVARTFAP